MKTASGDYVTVEPFEGNRARVRVEEHWGKASAIATRDELIALRSDIDLTIAHMDAVTVEWSGQRETVKP